MAKPYITVFFANTASVVYYFFPYFHHLGGWYLGPLGPQLHFWLVAQLGFKSCLIFWVQRAHVVN